MTEGDQAVRPAPGRRAFLRFAAAAGGASLLAACSGQGSSTSAVSPSSSPAAGPPAAADWTALGHDLSGSLIRPGDSGYATAKELFDPRFDSLQPAGIAYCHQPQDVSACLAFARRYGVPVAARCGGHSYAGWSSTSGLIVDVTAMSQVSLSGTTATVGAGTRLIDLYSGLAGQGRAVPGGSCPTVGLSGLALGGGIGVVGRAYGLTCDNVQSLQIVTADGQVRTADASTNPDLYWACRGGGGGNFGIVTSFTFRTHPAGDIVLFFLSWPWSQAAKVIAGWQSWAPHEPDELWSNLHLSASTGGSVPSIQVGGTYLGSASAAAAELEKLYAAVGSDPSSPYVETTTWLHAMLVEAGCADLTPTECHLPTQVSGGQLSRSSEYAKSDFFTTPLSSSAIGTLLSGVEKFSSAGGASGASGGIALDALGGAINRVAPGDTAFVHRDALFDAQYTTTWPGGAPAAAVSRQQAWQRSFWQSMRPFASGQAYQNYIDPDLPNWQQAYYGANYTRLAQIKATYDPHRLFTFPQAV